MHRTTYHFDNRVATKLATQAAPGGVGALATLKRMRLVSHSSRKGRAKKNG
jgi:hypothetical protein